MASLVPLPARIHFGAFELDAASAELRKDGHLIRLQPQAIQVLILLTEHAGQVVLRERIRESLWGQETFVDFDRGINFCVNQIRAALGENAEAPRYVETVPRRGYRFIAPVKTEEASSKEEWDTALGLNQWLPQRHPADVHGSAGPKPESPRGGLNRTVLVENGQNQRAIEEIEPELDAVAPILGIRKYRNGLAWVLAAALLVLSVASGLSYLRHVRGPERTMHFSLPLSSAIRDLALSHDGRVLAFLAPRSNEGGNTLWVHEVGASDAHSLENSEGASFPFWSPDDKFIAFFADGKLKKIAAAGGPVQVICDAPIGRGGTWNRSGVIVFARDSGVAIYQVSDAGGAVTLVNGFEQKVATTLSSRWPVFLPDGKHFLYTSVDFGADLRGEANAIYLAALDSREHRRLVTSNSNAAYIPPGYLLFLRNRTLMAQRFDTEGLRVVGQAFAVANEVEYLSSVARALFSVSENGTLVYQNGSGASFSELGWFDREGKQLSTLGIPARYASPRLSPDGKKVAVDIDDPQSSNTDIWLIEATQEVRYRLTFDPSQDETPLWSHDGRHILWLSDRGGKNGFYLKASDGSGAEEIPTIPAGVDLSFASALSDWSSDGRYLLYTDLQEGDVLHLWVLPMREIARPIAS